MENRTWVISLGGSRIIPNEVDFKFLAEFKKVIEKNKDKKFVVVCGGGSTARKYISALKQMNKTTRKQSEIGIAVTRLHAVFLTEIFGKDANELIPKDMKHASSLLAKNHAVFCGALRYKPNNTSDGTSANIAGYLKCPFINITNVRGLFSANPKTNKNAKFISHCSWKNFNERAKKIKFHAGQHFVLDQNAAEIIMNEKIPTYITNSLKDVDNIINGKDFKGSLISG
jgi:uridylate kinase